MMSPVVAAILRNAGRSMVNSRYVYVQVNLLCNK